MGVPVVGTVRLLSLRVPDPAGGPPWGMRVMRTTGGDECMQVGRVHDGRLGVLGQDGIFRDDHRFHPMPASAFGDHDCALVGTGAIRRDRQLEQHARQWPRGGRHLRLAGPR